MVIIKQSGYMYAKVKVNGREKRFSLGVKEMSDRDKAEVKRIYAETESIEKAKSILQKEEYDLAVLAQRYVDLMPKMRDKKYSISSIKTYSNVARHLEKFSTEYMPMMIDQYNLTGDLYEKRRRSEAFQNWFYSFDDWMKDREMSITSREPIMSVVNMFVRHWADYYFLSLPKVPRLEKVEKPIVVLEPEFYKKFMADDLYHRLDADMKIVWEVAATILASTMRISDVLSITPADVPNGEMFSKVTSKTGERCEVPVPEKLAAIYKENLKNGSLFSGHPDRELVYRNLRKLFSMYEELHHPHSSGGETKPMYEWVTPHMLRKTAITSYLYFGVSEMHVKHASAHSKDSKSFRRYTKVIETRFRSDFLAAHSRLGI